MFILTWLYLSKQSTMLVIDAHWPRESINGNSKRAGCKSMNISKYILQKKPRLLLIYPIYKKKLACYLHWDRICDTFKSDKTTYLELILQLRLKFLR